MFIAETKIEGELHPEWFRYVCLETKTSTEQNMHIEGICLYPVVNHPG